MIQYWDADELPDDLAELATSFERLNPERRHLVFNAREADAFIARHFTERELSAFRSCRSPAMQADYFRYCALLVLGGLYCDIDTRCVRDLDSLIEGVDRGELFQRVDGGIENALIIFKAPGDPLLELTLAIATTNIERRVSEDVRVTTGPVIFSALYLLLRLGSIEAFVELMLEGKLDSSIPLPRGAHRLITDDPANRVVGDLAPFTDVVCELVGDCATLAKTLDGVRVSLVTRYAHWITPVHARYKATDAHWSKASTSIYR